MTTSAHGPHARQRAPHSPSPRVRGEGRDEGRELAVTSEYAAAPHPSPLPVRTGRGNAAATRGISRLALKVVP
jgi:hypothetical protein